MSPAVAALVDLDLILMLWMSDLTDDEQVEVNDIVHREVLARGGDAGLVLASLVVMSLGRHQADPSDRVGMCLGEVAEQVAVRMVERDVCP